MIAPRRRYDDLVRDFRWEVPSEFNFGQMVDAWATDRSRVALYWEDEAGHTARLTFWDVKVASNRAMNALAGLGVGYFAISSSFGSGSTSAFATRYGGGMTVPINDSLAWKIEYSRMNFHLPTSANSAWTSGNNLSAGIVFTISN